MNLKLLGAVLEEDVDGKTWLIQQYQYLDGPHVGETVMYRVRAREVDEMPEEQRDAT